MFKDLISLKLLLNLHLNIIIVFFCINLFRIIIYYRLIWAYYHLNQNKELFCSSQNSSQQVWSHLSHLWEITDGSIFCITCINLHHCWGPFGKVQDTVHQWSFSYFHSLWGGFLQRSYTSQHQHRQRSLTVTYLRKGQDECVLTMGLEFCFGGGLSAWETKEVTKNKFLNEKST